MLFASPNSSSYKRLKEPYFLVTDRYYHQILTSAENVAHETPSPLSQLLAVNTYQHHANILELHATGADAHGSEGCITPQPYTCSLACFGRSIISIIPIGYCENKYSALGNSSYSTYAGSG